MPETSHSTQHPLPATIDDLRTPALVIDRPALLHNLAVASRALPGARLRPHVKAHKCTAIARLQAEAGHRRFTCATAREVIGLARAGLGEDLLLANEVVDVDLLGELAALDARVTIAVDSLATIEAAAAAGLREVLVDVNVGLPRCGCDPREAGRIADYARTAGLEVRGVMGYEGHCVGNPDRVERERLCRESMEQLAIAHDLVGGDIISAGATGTYDCNDYATEIQAGSYALMDTAYAALELPFRLALGVVSTVISSNPGFAVCDAGLKSLGMDHGNPQIDDAKVWFCSDEHVTFAPERASEVGTRLRVAPAHCDPTIAYHERLYVLEGDAVVDEWLIDLRGW